MSFGDEAMPEEERAFSEATGEGRRGRARPPPRARTTARQRRRVPALGALAEEADPREVLARERDEYLLALQRTQADFENYRKRVARLQDEQSARASSDLVDKLLPVLDTLDLAEAHLNESLEVTEDGKALRASRAMLMDILAKAGLERVDQAGVPFDPVVHDAVAQAEAQEGDGGQPARRRRHALGVPLEGTGAPPRHGPRPRVN